MEYSGLELHRIPLVRSCLAGAPDSATKWFGKLDDVADTMIAPAAGAVDRAAAHPQAAMESLRAIGAFGVQIPRSYGGLGFTNGAAALVVERVSRACASTAAILMFHYQVVNRTLQFGNSERRDDDLTAMADGTMIAASAWTEPSASTDKTDVHTTLSASGDELFVDGTKTYCTGLSSATVIDVLVNSELSEGTGPTFVRVVTKDSGVEVTEIYPMLGLRATSTGTIHLKDVPVTRQNVLGPLGSARDLMRANHEVPLNPGMLALGIATAAFQSSLTLHQPKPGAKLTRPLSESTRQALAQAAVLLESTYSYAADVVSGMTMQHHNSFVLSSKLKVQATTAAEKLTRRLMHVAGSHGFLTTFPLERHFRDAQATSLMGPTNDLCLARISTDILPAENSRMGPAR